VSFKEKLWSLLPDNCEVSDCCRKGMRGNENRIYPQPEVYPNWYIVMCDYCNSRYMDGRLIIKSIEYTKPQKDKIFWIRLMNSVLAQPERSRGRYNEVLRRRYKDGIDDYDD
jgi:hypothetical protein